VSFHVEYAPNSDGRDFVVGDLHGELEKFNAAIAAVDFDTSKDRCFSVGDLIDRGPDVPEVVKLVKEPWFHAVQGNHEQMMLGGPSWLWMANGGEWSLNLPQDNLREVGRLIRDLPFAITLRHRSGATVGICHAECPVEDWADIDAVEDDPVARERMIWSRRKLSYRSEDLTRGVDITVHGHTQVAQVERLGNALYIETGACFGGELTLLDLDDFFSDWAAGSGSATGDDRPAADSR